MPNTIIRIKEKNFTDNVFTVAITVKDANDHEEEAEIQLTNPYDEKTDKLLEWYFEQYISTPYDDVKVKGAIAAIKNYGTTLFEKLFTGNLLFAFKNALQHSSPEGITIEIVGESAAFQGIYWESLRATNQAHPLAALGTVFLRKNVRSVEVKAQVKESPTINLLIVTARPNEEADVNYRTIQRPLIDLIEKNQVPVQAHILRPGTYEALIRHLNEKEPGHYHIIHFDLHGSLLNYEDYQLFQKAVASGLSSQNNLFKGSFGLKELQEEDFNGGKKAFIFFESDEKQKAVPVDAGQLADFLENKQIPICILNACQSAKQEHSAHETSLGRVLMQKGMQLVLAMRYSVSVTAAKKMMERLYEQLYRQQPIAKAIAASRQELYNDKQRNAAYGKKIDLEDWLLPVAYQNGKPVLKIRAFTSQEEENYYSQRQLPEEVEQELVYGFFGRDLDILKIEKNLLLRSNILLLQGMGGAGKTTLLKYLCSWWLRTGFIEKAFYFGYDVKAYTLNEILYYIAGKIYDRHQFGAFIAKRPEIQEANIVTELKAKQCVLILDNAESITGEKLAIQHTLTPEERKKLKRFIASLKEGSSHVIIGSRANEEWLKGGTFENNCYLLGGLDPESASSFASKILKDINIVETDIISDPDFSRLMKLLAGFPLALKAILPNLRNKTATRILDDLQKGVDEIDKGNPQQRTESIIKCIEYAHSNLSEESQQILLCLAPFQSVIDFSTINYYLNELKKDALFENYNFEKLKEVVDEAIQNGLMEIEVPATVLGLIRLQPLFTYFLKNKLRHEPTLLQNKLQIAYCRYYQVLSEDYFRVLQSNIPSERIFVFSFIKKEYENFYKALNLLLESQTSISKIANLLDEFLEREQEQEKRVALLQLLDHKLQLYPPENMTDKIQTERFDIKLRLGRTYFTLRRFEDAQAMFEGCLALLNLIQNEYVEHNMGIIYNWLGNTLKEKKDLLTAQDYYEKALELFEKFDDFSGAGYACVNLGTIKLSLEHLNDAKQYSLKGLNWLIKAKDYKALGNVCMVLGDITQSMKDYISAENYYLKAIELSEKYLDIGLKVKIYTHFGELLVGLKRFSEAENSFYKAMEYCHQTKDILSEALIYENLGKNSFLKGDISYAKNYYSKAEVKYKSCNDFYRLGRVSNIKGLLFKEEADFINARHFFEKALESYIKIGNGDKLFILLLNNIYNLTKETDDKSFGQVMIQKALLHFEGKTKDDLIKVLDDINQL